MTIEKISRVITIQPARHRRETLTDDQTWIESMVKCKTFFQKG